MPQPFENVREELLRAGIAPRHARRYVTELREHLNDVTARERATGLPSREAEERATAVLGSDAQLVQAMLDKGAPRSLAYRSPWSVFAVLPVALFILLILGTGISMMFLLGPVRGLAPSDMPAGYLSLISAASFASRYLLGPLLVTGCIAIALRQRLRTSWFWVGIGLIAMLSGPFGFHMNFIPSAGGGEGTTLYSVLGIIYEQGRADPVATLAVAALRSTALFMLAAIAWRALQVRVMPARD
jgi:hypothetical protein